MYFPPCFAQHCHVFPQNLSNVVYLVIRETNILPQTRRAIWTVQIEDSFAPLSDDVDVRRTVIVEIDVNAQTPYSQDGRHGKSVSQT
jgi:hypothetical protein